MSTERSLDTVCRQQQHMQTAIPFETIVKLTEATLWEVRGAVNSTLPFFVF